MMTATAHDYRIRHLVWRDRLGNVLAQEYEVRSRSDSSNRLKLCSRFESLTEAHGWLISRGVDIDTVQIYEKH